MTDLIRISPLHLSSPLSRPPNDSTMVKASLCILSLAAVAQGFLLPVPAPHRPPSSTQLAASAFTTVSGRIVEDPKGELQKVLTPSPKDEARRARVAKVLEAAGLQYTGEAIFSSNRWYGGAVYRDFTDAVGVEPADQVPREGGRGRGRGREGGREGV
ncbi:hypothetical protein Naga_101131g1 [Nannochloropsis gaditana]|uniref:Uncharacterized protein n=1 Tax=Nannochloropsis gaditana TaxID=72520 RepID=W7TT72_9STRA|nr:hypothetical protein Naga_101131g1 [Nannochloropsis gaditana]